MTVGNTPTTLCQETPSLPSLARQPTVTSQGGKDMVVHINTYPNSVPPLNF